MRLALLTVVLSLAGCRDAPPQAPPRVEARVQADSAGGGVDSTTADEAEAELDMIEGALNGEVLP